MDNQKPKHAGKVFTIRSESNSKQYYEVQQQEDGRWLCSCKAFEYSASIPRSCKHIRKLQTMLEP